MAKPSLQTLHILEAEIAAKRQRMMDLWDARGFLAASIELDELLNIYQKLQP